MQVTKSEQQQIKEMIAEEAELYLDEVYGEVVEQEVSKGAGVIAQEYLSRLY